MNSVHDHEHKCPENALETYKALTKHLLVAYKVITNQVAYVQVALTRHFQVAYNLLKVFYKALRYLLYFRE